MNWVISNEKKTYNLTVEGAKVRLEGHVSFYKDATEALREAYALVRLFESLGYTTCLVPTKEDQKWG